MGKTKQKSSDYKARVNGSKRVSHSGGDTLHTTEDVYYNEDEEGFEINFIGGHLVKSKFTSTFVKHTLYDKEDSSIEEDPSASDVPDSIEFKSIQSERSGIFRNVPHLGRWGGICQNFPSYTSPSTSSVKINTDINY